MRHQSFSQKLQKLVIAIRQDGILSVADACMLLEVGPWQIERYAKLITRTWADISYDKDTGFKAVIFKLSPTDTTLDKHTHTNTPRNPT